MTSAEARSNILTFIAAGHETTANSLTWSLFLLRHSPYWRERVRSEAREELGGPIDHLGERLLVTRANRKNDRFRLSQHAPSRSTAHEVRCALGYFACSLGDGPHSGRRASRCATDNTVSGYMGARVLRSK